MKITQLSLIAATVILCLPSCKNTTDEEATATSGETEHEQRVVTITCNEEQVSISEEPMARAAAGEGQKTIGVSIYKQTADGYEPYAYGLYDGTASINAVLDEGDKYMIECIELKAVEDTLYHDRNWYYEPFMTGNKPTELTNTMTYSSTSGFDNMTEGKYALYVKDVNGKPTRYYAWNPSAYTYFGGVEDFDPATSASVTLNLHRAVFGLHFIVTPPSNGSVSFNFLNLKGFTVSKGDAVYDHESVYSFSDIINGTADDYSSNIRVFSTWTQSDGSVERDTINVPVTRNQTTVVELSFSGPKDEGFSLNEESGGFTSDTLQYVIGKK